MSRYLYKEEIDKADKILFYLMSASEIATAVFAGTFTLAILAVGGFTVFYWDRIVIYLSYILNSTICT